MRNWLGIAAALGGAALAAHCHLITGNFEVDAGAGGSATNTTSTSTGDAALTLVSQDVIVRYFLDDGAPGDTPQQATDSAAAPLMPINIDYGEEVTDAGTSVNVAWVDVDGNRGLAWQRYRGAGYLETPIADSKITDALQTARTLTIELVTQLDGEVSDTRLLFLGESSSDYLSLRVNSDTEIELHHNADPSLIGRWQVGMLERKVLHIVIDTTQDDENQRVRLLVNGAEVGSTDATPPPVNDPLRIVAGSLFLGNDSGGSRSIQGTLYYAALYARPLTPAQVSNNVAILSSDDDSPE